MKIEQLLNNNPLSKELFKQWFLDKLVESTKLTDEVPQEFKDALLERGIEDDLLIKYIENNSHSLFEIFDNNELFIDIFRKKMQFTFDVNSAQIENRYFMFRKDAEKQAIVTTIALLENKLTQIKNTDG